MSAEETAKIAIALIEERLRELLEIARRVHDEGDLEAGWERLRRWERYTVRGLAEYLGPEEATGMQEARGALSMMDPVGNLTGQVRAYEAFLVCLREELESRPESLVTGGARAAKEPAELPGGRGQRDTARLERAIRGIDKQLRWVSAIADDFIGPETTEMEGEARLGRCLLKTESLLSELVGAQEAKEFGECARWSDDPLQQIDSCETFLRPLREELAWELTGEDTASMPAPTGKAAARDVFLSYSTRDGRDADRLRQSLEGAGLTCFMAPKDVEGGDDFADAIRDALEASREMCLLATPGSLEREWVATEWGAAWALRKRITPVLLRCAAEQLPDRLRRRQCVDFHDITRFVEEFRRRWEGKSSTSSRTNRQDTGSSR